jgi:hypothetical protein
MVRTRPLVSALVLSAVVLGVLAPAALAQSASSAKRDVIAALRAGRPQDAISAVERLGRIGDKAAANALVDLIDEVPQGAVFTAVAKALTGMSGDEADEAIAKKLKSGAADRRMLLCDVAASRKGEATFQALLACLRHSNDALARAATRALVARRDKRAVEPLVDLLEGIEGKPGSGAGLVRRALRDLTGKDLFLAIEWRGWWKVHGVKGLPSAREAERALAAGEETGKTRSRFFGRELDSDRIVFVIDISGSMQKKDAVKEGGRPVTGDEPERTSSRVRIDRAKAELIGAIMDLPEEAQFTIIAYSGYLPPGTPMPQGVELPNEKNWIRALSSRLTKASESGKEKARDFVDGLKAIGSTFTGRAVEAALDIKGADLVILLSDGAPTEWADEGGKVKRLGANEVRARIQAANRTRRLTIDTFGFAGDGYGMGDDRFTEFMKGVAKDNGGRFHAID